MLDGECNAWAGRYKIYSSQVNHEGVNSEKNAHPLILSMTT